MNRRELIIQDAEVDMGEPLDENFDPGVNGLCDGDTCRHAECECWYSFQLAVEEQLEKQQKEWGEKFAHYLSLYTGEVKAGIHVPAHRQEAG